MHRLAVQLRYDGTASFRAFIDLEFEYDPNLQPLA
jgi:hypothetical protein